MIFNSFQFLWLFPIIFIGYYFLQLLFPESIRKHGRMANVLLLVISYGLYMQWKPVFALVLLGVTVITYSFAIIIEKKKAFGCKKYLIYSGILLALLPLLIFKYANFVNEILTNVVGGG